MHLTSGFRQAKVLKTRSFEQNRGDSMSMIMMVESVPATELTLHENSADDTPFSPRLFDPESIEADSVALEDVDEGFDEPEALDAICLEKTWHGIHFLLVGEVWSGAEPAGFLVEGGVEGEDMGYGPTRTFDPTQVQAIAEYLDGVSSEQLWANYDAAKFTSAGIYPEIWDEPADELEEEYVDSFEMLKEFVAQVAESGDSLRIVLE